MISRGIWWGVALMLAIGLMAAPAARAQAPAGPGTPEPPTVEIPQPPEPPDVEVPEPPDVKVPEPPKVDPPEPPDVGTPGAPTADEPDKPAKPRDDEDAGPADRSPQPEAAAKPQPDAAQPVHHQSSATPKAARRQRVHPAAPRRRTAVPAHDSKATSSRHTSAPAVAEQHRTSAAVKGRTSLPTVAVGDPSDAGGARHPRPAPVRAPSFAAQVEPARPRAVTLNGSGDRYEITLALGLLFTAIAAYMIGRTFSRGVDTKDRYRL